MMGDNDLVNPQDGDAKLSRTLRNQELVIQAYAEVGNLSEAARTASVPVSTAYFWLHNDQDFKDQYWIADRVYGDSVRSIIRKRIEDPTGNRGSDAPKGYFWLG